MTPLTLGSAPGLVVVAEPSVMSITRLARLPRWRRSDQTRHSGYLPRWKGRGKSNWICCWEGNDEMTYNRPSPSSFHPSHTDTHTHATHYSEELCLSSPPAFFFLVSENLEILQAAEEFFFSSRPMRRGCLVLSGRQKSGV